MVTVTALKPFVYRDKSVSAGASVEMVPVDALASARRGDVSLSRGVVVRPKTLPDSAEPESPVRRRTYRRRDMQAEQAAEAPSRQVGDGVFVATNSSSVFTLGAAVKPESSE